jgi:hypothetical protein
VLRRLVYRSYDRKRTQLNKPSWSLAPLERRVMLAADAGAALDAGAAYNNVGTSQQTYTYQAGSTIAPEQVRIAFTNDAYDPANGIDRNLIVDNIRIDGITFETEGTDVLSTGTWLPADGIAPGFGRGDTLFVNGYFQYAATGGNGGGV